MKLYVLIVFIINRIKRVILLYYLFILLYLSSIYVQNIDQNTYYKYVLDFDNCMNIVQLFHNKLYVIGEGGGGGGR